MPIILPVLFFDSERGGDHKSYFSCTRRYKMSRWKAIHHFNKSVTAVLFYTFSLFLLTELKDGRVNLETWDFKVHRFKWTAEIKAVKMWLLYKLCSSVTTRNSSNSLLLSLGGGWEGQSESSTRTQEKCGVYKRGWELTCVLHPALRHTWESAAEAGLCLEMTQWAPVKYLWQLEFKTSFVKPAHLTDFMMSHEMLSFVSLCSVKLVSSSAKNQSMWHHESKELCEPCRRI